MVVVGIVDHCASSVVITPGGLHVYMKVHDMYIHVQMMNVYLNYFITGTITCTVVGGTFI